MIQQIVFILIAAITFFFAFKQYSKIVRNIRLGKSEKISGNVGDRIKNVALIAFGQKKMFKRWIPAIMHLFIYVAFLFTQIELIEIIIDGTFGIHRFFGDKLGALYNVIINSIEFLSVGAFVATIVFLARRNLLKLPRFTMAEMKGWPFKDGNLILIGELLLLM
ncbi:MAG: Fe-S oxidoreductase, partial [Saprospiraceae bacterium]|nr:Fe-S oxidoreductase [Saprospiraceae bacterium]